MKDILIFQLDNITISSLILSVTPIMILLCSGWMEDPAVRVLLEWHWRMGHLLL